jgi:hypothetical protein
MTPRPFMVERGHDDGVAPDEWVAWEFAKVYRHYDVLGLGDKAEIEFFNGPHKINGVKTYDFLHRHLSWRRSVRLRRQCPIRYGSTRAVAEFCQAARSKVSASPTGTISDRLAKSGRDFGCQLACS